MTRTELFFNNLLANISSIDTEMQPYYVSNSTLIEGSETRSNLFAEFNILLNDFIADLIEIKNRNELIEDYDLIDNFSEKYETFINAFANFPINLVFFLKYWTFIAKKLNDIKDETLNLNEVINNLDFKIIDLEENIIEKNFIDKSSNLEKNIIIYNYSDELANFLNEEIHTSNEDLLLIWLSLLPPSIVQANNQYVLLKLNIAIELRKLKSLLKIVVLKNGKLIKSLEVYSASPYLPINHDLNFNESYNQFDLISNILNEYNNQKFLLDKYLKLYHIIENFMYKQKICEIQNKRAGVPLYIRDFQILYDRFSTSELDAMKEFFKGVLLLNYNTTTKFGNIVKQSWDNLVTLNPTIITEINTLLESLRLNQTYDQIKNQSELGATTFSKLVYFIRNAVVHNKDSETHFESTHMPNSLKFLLENYLIPNLERIVFHLIINKNDLVWYSDDKLLLYHN